MFRNCCTDRLQPLDLSVNKAVKCYLSDKFLIWYAFKVKKQLDRGNTAKNIIVDMKLSVIKEVSAGWLEAAYHYMKASESLIINGYKKSGMFEAISNPPPNPL